MRPRAPVRRTGVTAAVGLVGAVVYSDWLVLEPTIGRDLSPVRTYISELGALTRPHHEVVDLLEVVSGACILLFAVGLADVLPAAARTRLGTVGLAVVWAPQWHPDRSGDIDAYPELSSNLVAVARKP
jgi:hypothetical protein